KKINNWIVFIAFILAAFYYADILDVVVRKIKETTSTIEQRLEVAAEEINKKELPVKVVDNMYFVSAKNQGSSMHFKYLVSNVDSKEVDTDYWEKQLYAIHKNDACNGGSRKLLDDGAGLIFEYYDFNDIRFASVSINKNDCVDLE
ncbi:hypothetical protein LHO48_005084, partial [Salmonella enterica]|nr:hypothetical protein [Salmonella enterica]